MEDLQIVESVVRKDPKVIEQCRIIGIPPEDMHKVYCDRKSSRTYEWFRLIVYSVDDWL
jgi:Cu2+-containing amine oxidase